MSDDAKEYPIVSLFLGNNRIEDDAIDLVTYGVSECKTLRVLSLVYNCISGKGIQSLWERKMGHLRELHLDGNARIGDAGARIISECISNGNLNLEYLGLASCEIGNKGCSNLFDGLASARAI